MNAYWPPPIAVGDELTFGDIWGTSRVTAIYQGRRQIRLVRIAQVSQA